MQIALYARSFSLTDALRNHAEQRLRLALTRHAEHVRRVVVRLSDINGPRGGADMRCDLQVMLSGLPDVVTNATATDLYFAISRAAERASHGVMRRLRRQRRHQHPAHPRLPM